MLKEQNEKIISSIENIEPKTNFTSNDNSFLMPLPLAEKQLAETASDDSAVLCCSPPLAVKFNHNVPKEVILESSTEKKIKRNQQEKIPINTRKGTRKKVVNYTEPSLRKKMRRI